MLLGETDPDRRHVGPLRALDGDGNPVTGEDFSGAGELEISVGGDAFTAALGSVVEIAAGYYYYMATAGDASVGPWIAIKISGVCQEFTFREDVAEQLSGIIAGETDADLLAVGPLRFVDSDGNPLGSADIAGATKYRSKNGDAWSVPSGSFAVNDDGYLIYTADPSEVFNPGWLAVWISGTCQDFVFREDIVAVSTGDEVSPTITAVSPTPGTEPGAAGGFPGGRNAALETPIVIEIIDADPGVGYLLVTLRTYQDGDTNGHTELTVYRDGIFREPFGSSTQSGTSNDLILNIRRDDGWTGLFLELTVYVTDSDGNTASEQFVYELPDTFEPTVSEVPEGALDHTAAALARIPWQYRSEAHD